MKNFFSMIGTLKQNKSRERDTTKFNKNPTIAKCYTTLKIKKINVISARSPCCFASSEKVFCTNVLKVNFHLSVCKRERERNRTNCHVSMRSSYICILFGNIFVSFLSREKVELTSTFSCLQTGKNKNNPISVQ